MKVSAMKTFLLQFFSLMMLCEPYYSSFFQEAHALGIQYTIPTCTYIYYFITTRTKPSLYYGTVRVLKTCRLGERGDYPLKKFQNNERTKTKIENKEKRDEKETFLYKKFLVVNML